MEEEHFLSLDAFARVAHISRQSLSRYIQLGLIEPSAWAGLGRPLFRRSDVYRVTDAVGQIRSRTLLP
jgi:hypothetical protein